MSAARAVHHLRRFGLGSSASRDQLRKAYFEQAKKLHPDVAGPGGEADFKTLQEAYREALDFVEKEAIRKKYAGASGSKPSGDGSGPQGGYGWQTNPDNKNYEEFYRQQAYHPNFGTSAQQKRKTTYDHAGELTPAQRLRNVIMAAGGVVGLAYSVSWLAQPSPLPAGHSSAAPKPAPRRETAVRAPVEDRSGVGSDGALPVIDLRPAGQGGGEDPNVVSNYYKSRHQKGSIRVRETDSGHDYKAPTESAKSRHKEEGLGQTASMLADFALGAKPSESRDGSTSTGGPPSPPTEKAA